MFAKIRLHDVIAERVAANDVSFDYYYVPRPPTAPSQLSARHPPIYGESRSATGLRRVTLAEERKGRGYVLSRDPPPSPTFRGERSSSLVTSRPNTGKRTLYTASY